MFQWFLDTTPEPVKVAVGEVHGQEGEDQGGAIFRAGWILAALVMDLISVFDTQPAFPLTYASKIAGVGPRKPTDSQTAYGQVSFTYLSWAMWSPPSSQHAAQASEVQLHHKG